MTIKEREWSDTSFNYRFGFNGKESDDEVSGEGNTIAFEARIYDSRLGRFFTTDPWQHRYAWQTPYAYFANSPIVKTDFQGKGDGDKPKAPKIKEKVKKGDGAWQISQRTGVSMDKIASENPDNFPGYFSGTDESDETYWEKTDEKGNPLWHLYEGDELRLMSLTEEAVAWDKHSEELDKYNQSLMTLLELRVAREELREAIAQAKSLPTAQTILELNESRNKLRRYAAEAALFAFVEGAVIFYEGYTALKMVNGALKVGEYSYTATAGAHWTEMVTKGVYHGKRAREFMGSPLLIEEIIGTGAGVADASAVGATSYRVSGVYRGTKGTWQLVVDQSKKIIYHFNFVK